MSSRTAVVFGAALAAAVALVLLGSVFWTAPVAVTYYGGASPLVLIAQGLAGAIAATFAGRLFARAFPRR